MPVSQSDTGVSGVGGGDLAATTLTDIYTAPSIQKNSVKYAKTLFICNRSASPVTFRVAYAPLGAADAVDQYLMYDVVLAANDTFTMDMQGIRLNPTDVIRVFSSSGDVTATLFVDSRP